MGTIGSNIRAMREKAEMTQEQLADVININRVTLAKYEADRSIPGAKILSKIAVALHVSLDVLTGIDDDIKEGDDEIWKLREQLRRDPDRRALLKLAQHGTAQDVRQAVALIDALRATNPEFYNGDDPS